MFRKSEQKVFGNHVFGAVSSTAQTKRATSLWMLLHVEWTEACK